METQAFGFKLRANAPEGQKLFPIGLPRCELQEPLRQNVI